MEEIIKTLLLEGIDEGTVHKVLDVIEEEYEVVNEMKDSTVHNMIMQRKKNFQEHPHSFYDKFKFRRASLAARDRKCRQNGINPSEVENREKLVKRIEYMKPIYTASKKLERNILTQTGIRGQIKK